VRHGLNLRRDSNQACVNNLVQADGNTTIYNINTWLAARIKKLQMKGTVEKRVNIMAFCHMKETLLVNP